MTAPKGSAGDKRAVTGTAFPRGVSQPAVRALAAAGYTQLNQLAQAWEADLAKLHGMGPKALRILDEALREQGKGFRR